MPRLLPPSQELLAFIASARHGSFTAAALELSITQGAVSKSVQSLESMLGLTLFERVKQRIVLTDAGRAYFGRVQPLVAGLEQATLAIRSSKDTAGVVRFSTIPTFGASWLIPRMPKFAALHPDIRVDFVSHSLIGAVSNAEQSPPDLLVKFGEGVWPGLHSRYLIGREISFLTPKKLRKLKHPGDLEGLNLMHHRSLPHAWHDWSKAHKMRSGGDLYAGRRFDQYSMLIEAVIAGLGVALVPKCLVENEIALGELSAPFTASMPGWNGYFLCSPLGAPGNTAVQQFGDWLINQACSR